MQAIRVDFSNDANTLAVGGGFGAASILKRQRGQWVITATFKHHIGHVRAVPAIAFALTLVLQIYAVCFSPNDDYLLLGSYDKTASLWPMRTETGEWPANPITVYCEHTNTIAGAAFCAVGTELLAMTGSWDRTISIWRITNGMTIARLGARNPVRPSPYFFTTLISPCR